LVNTKHLLGTPESLFGFYGVYTTYTWLCRP